MLPEKFDSYNLIFLNFELLLNCGSHHFLNGIAKRPFLRIFRVYQRQIESSIWSLELYEEKVSFRRLVKGSVLVVDWEHHKILVDQIGEIEGVVHHGCEEAYVSYSDSAFVDIQRSLFFEVVV